MRGSRTVTRALGPYKGRRVYEGRDTCEKSDIPLGTPANDASMSHTSIGILQCPYLRQAGGRFRDTTDRAATTCAEPNLPPVRRLLSVPRSRQRPSPLFYRERNHQGCGRGCRGNVFPQSAGDTGEPRSRSPRRRISLPGIRRIDFHLSHL
jgi:hypothetical protein